jgi:hypothetical protein
MSSLRLKIMTNAKITTLRYLEKRGLIWRAENREEEGLTEQIPIVKIYGSEQNNTLSRHTSEQNNAFESNFINHVLHLFKKGTIHQWSTNTIRGNQSDLSTESKATNESLKIDLNNLKAKDNLISINIIKKPLVNYLVLIPIIKNLINHLDLQNKHILLIGDLSLPTANILNYLGQELLKQTIFIPITDNSNQIYTLLNYSLRSPATGICIVYLKKPNLTEVRKLANAIKVGGGVCFITTPATNSSHASPGMGFHSNWQISFSIPTTTNNKDIISPQFYVYLDKIKGNKYPTKTWRVKCELEETIFIRTLSSFVS